MITAEEARNLKSKRTLKAALKTIEDLITQYAKQGVREARVDYYTWIRPKDILDPVCAELVKNGYKIEKRPTKMRYDGKSFTLDGTGEPYFETWACW